MRVQAEKNAIKLAVRPGEPHLEQWIHGWASVADVTPVFGADGLARFKGAFWRAGSVLFNHFETSGQVVRRTPDHLGSYSQLLSIQRVLGGSGRGESLGSAFELSEQAFTVIDYAYPYTMVHRGGPVTGFTVSKAAIDYPGGSMPPVRTIDARRGRGRVLHRQLAAIFETLRRGSAPVIDLEPFLTTLTCELVPERASAQMRRRDDEARLDSIRDHIEAHLASPDLAPETIVELFGVSRRTLYRKFDAFGGVRSYIEMRRLHRAVTELAALPRKRGDISKIAARWGYSSDAAFSRVVRRHFGRAPGQLLERDLPAGRRPSLAPTLHDQLSDPS